MIEIQDITIENIKNNGLLKELPEFYELKNCFENNDWHHETTFEHVLMFLEEYEKALNAYRLDFLEEIVEENNKKDLFKVIILLHDISKIDTIEIKEDKTTVFPDHDKAGGQKATVLLNKFAITAKERDYIVKIISNHTEPHQILYNRETCDEKLEEFSQKIGSEAKELMFFAMIDTIASKLRENNREEYDFRFDKYRGFLGL